MGKSEIPGAHDGEGDIDEDRQDPPRPEKTVSPDGDDDGGELDGTKATPGDDPDGGDA